MKKKKETPAQAYKHQRQDALIIVKQWVKEDERREREGFDGDEEMRGALLLLLGELE